MMTGAPGIPFVAAADSARAVATVYTASLLAFVPIGLAAVGALWLRRASAEARVLVWRSAIVSLLLMFVGRQLPLHWVAWVVPSTLAAPLVALGRVQVTSAADTAAVGRSLVSTLFIAYIVGVTFVSIRTVLASIRVRAIARRSSSLGGAWQQTLGQARVALGVKRSVRLVASSEANVPMTWGWLRPVIVIPSRALDWNSAQRKMVLAHELSHIASADWAFAIAGRVVCALFWFHPAAWWLAARLREDAELSCDARVIASGVKRSDYAELLVGAADRFLSLEPALALSQPRGLRGRLAAVLDVKSAIRPIARGWIAVAMCGTVAVAGPMSAVQLAPTREVLTTLMTDARWETRAWAVLGLASRPDSVAVARTAAERDPNPRVRAWARYALGEQSSADLRAVLHP
jgi:beta-lactamase regulating signal transducer with metallopeptidase domain